MIPIYYYMQKSSSIDWSPIDLGVKLQNWFDASTVETDGSTVSGGNVTAWRDKANGVTLIKSGAGTASLSTQNGNNVINFDGQLQFVSTNKSDFNYLHQQDIAVFCVINVGGISGVNDILGIINSGGHRQGNVGLAMNYEDRNTRTPARDNQIHYRVTRGTPGSVEMDDLYYNIRILSDDNYLIRDKYTLIAARTNVNQNDLDSKLFSGGLLAGGAEKINEYSQADSTDFFSIGSLGGFPFESRFIGNVAEIILCSAPLTDIEFNNTINYLNSKWNLTNYSPVQQIPINIPWISAWYSEGSNFVNTQGPVDGGEIIRMEAETRWNDYYPLVIPVDLQERRLTYRESGINGQPSIEGDGIDDIIKTAATAAGYYPIASPGLPSPITIAIVGQYLTASGTLCDGDGTTYRLGVTGGNFEMESPSGTITGGAADTNPHLFILEFNGANSKLIIDGTEYSGDLGNTDTLDGLTFFARTNTTDFANAQIAFAGIYHSILTASDKTSIENWASTKYGITIN